MLSNFCQEVSYRAVFRCKMDLRREEEIEKDVFLMECAQDVTIRDQMSILQRSFQTRNQVCRSIYPRACFLMLLRT